MNAFKSKLKDEAWVKGFEEYLTERFCPENILFLVAVEEYRELALNEQAEEARAKGEDIITQFLDDSAPQELNLSYSHRSEASEALRQTEDGDIPDSAIFDDAQVSIILLIMDYYKDYCNQSTPLGNLSSKLVDAVDQPVLRPRTQTISGDTKDEDEAGGGGSCFGMFGGIFGRAH